VQRVYTQSFGIKGLNQTPPVTSQNDSLSTFKTFQASQPTHEQPQPSNAGIIKNSHSFWNKNTHVKPRVNQDYERGFKERYQQMMENQNRPMPDGEGEEVNSEAEE
jgi:hypothetical protein